MCDLSVAAFATKPSGKRLTYKGTKQLTASVSKLAIGVQVPAAAQIQLPVCPGGNGKRSTRGSTGSLTPLTTTQTSTNPGGIPINQAAAVISANLQERLARVSEQFANSNKDGIDKEDLEDPDLKESPASKRIRIDQGQSDEASFQPYIATAKEAANAAAAAAGVTPRTSPHILDNALTAAINEAISTDMM